MKSAWPRTEIASGCNLKEAITSWLALTVKFTKSGYVKYIMQTASMGISFRMEILKRLGTSYPRTDINVTFSVAVMDANVFVWTSVREMYSWWKLSRLICSKTTIALPWLSVKHCFSRTHIYNQAVCWISTHASLICRITQLSARQVTQRIESVLRPKKERRVLHVIMINKDTVIWTRNWTRPLSDLAVSYAVTSSYQSRRPIDLETGTWLIHWPQD